MVSQRCRREIDQLAEETQVLTLLPCRRLELDSGEVARASVAAGQIPATTPQALTSTAVRPEQGATHSYSPPAAACAENRHSPKRFSARRRRRPRTSRPSTWQCSSKRWDTTGLMHSLEWGVSSFPPQCAFTPVAPLLRLLVAGCQVAPRLA